MSYLQPVAHMRPINSMRLEKQTEADEIEAYLKLQS
jgi:hypothetical protein